MSGARDPKLVVRFPKNGHFLDHENLLHQDNGLRIWT
jgi:hypothetical protein